MLGNPPPQAKPGPGLPGAGHGPRSLRNSSPAASQLHSFYQIVGNVDDFLKGRFYFTADRRAFQLQDHEWVPGLPGPGPGCLLHQPHSPPEPGEGPLSTRGAALLQMKEKETDGAPQASLLPCWPA